jgi:hypothetical protein
LRIRVCVAAVMCTALCWVSEAGAQAVKTEPGGAPPAGVKPYTPPKGFKGKPGKLTLLKGGNRLKSWVEAGGTGPASLPLGSPTDASPSSSSVTTLATILRRIFSNPAGWTSLRPQPGWFTVGNAQNGWGFDLVSGRLNSGYQFGWIGGGNYSNGEPRVAGCLWTQATYVATEGQTPTADCSPWASIPESSYMVAWNGNVPGVNCTSSGQCDGRPIQMDNAAVCGGGTWLYQNVRPYAPYASNPVEAFQWISYSEPLKWRYITKDWRYVMVRMPSRGNAGLQDWGFVPKVCFSDALFNPTYGPTS